MRCALFLNKVKIDTIKVFIYIIVIFMRLWYNKYSRFNNDLAKDVHVWTT